MKQFLQSSANWTKIKPSHHLATTDMIDQTTKARPSTAKGTSFSKIKLGIPLRRFHWYAALATAAVISPSLTTIAQASLEDSPKNTVDEVWQIINREYVDREFNGVDWQRKRQELLSREYPDRESAYEAIREMLEEIGDSYTRFLEPEAFEQLTSQTSGSLSGIGIRLTVDEQSKDIVITESIANSPAVQAGVQAGDKILKIDGKSTATMTLEQASEAIRGEEGTEVSLELLRQGKEPFEVVLTRSQIELPSVSYEVKQEGDARIGYIQLDEFSSPAAKQMRAAIEKLEQQQVSGFVLDLRGNPGGLLYASVDIVRMFLADGVIVKTTDRQGGDRVFKANGTALTDLPLVVLVDQGSASASEIITGALKDNRRATIVGTSTYGKGTVQSVHSLSDGSGLAVTISRYYPPSGIDINGTGIAPDINVNLTKQDYSNLRSDARRRATELDPQYREAVKVLLTSQKAMTFPSPSNANQDYQLR